MSKITMRRGVAATMLLVLVLAVPSAVRPQRAAADPVIAYPNLQVEVPTNSLSIATPTQSTRVLDFSHITWNAGAGPLEFVPSYDPSTGTSRAVQNLYTLTGNSTWSFVTSVPIVKPLVWHPPTDYAFPFTGFGLYTNNNGTVGSLVASSPKTLFCMEPDFFVGGVPNSTATASPAVSNCTNPNGTYGLSVGWGDEYSYPDSGNNIDISNVPNGTYWLRAQADPYGYFAQGGPNQSVTDTEITITGTTLTVIKQVTPVISPPVVTITSPTAGATVTNGSVLQASVTDPATVQSVQFLLDGAPLGAPVTSAPYSLPVASLPAGQHLISAQAVDSNNLTGTAPAVAFTVPVQVGTIQIDNQVNATGNGTVNSPTFSTAAPGELLLALVGADASGAGQTASVSGGGLTWSLVKRANAQLGTSEIWKATATGTLTGATVTATATQKKDLSLTVMSFENAAGVGVSGIASARSGAPSVSLTATAAGSLGVAVGNDYDNAIPRTLGTGQTLVSQWLDTTGDTYWSQYTSSPTTAVGSTIKLNDTAPTGDRFNLAGVEVTPGTAAPPPPGPSIVIDTPTSGQTVSGTVSITTTATANGGAMVKSVQLLLDGQPLGAALTTPPFSYSWDSTKVTNGAHSIGANVTDSNGAVGTAVVVPITVTNAAPTFTVSITSPKEGHTVSGTIPITATATSTNPITKVQLYLDGLPFGAALTTAPYSATWDTTTAMNGFHTLTAVATDSSNATATSAPVSVSVSNISVCFNTDVNVTATGKGPVTTPSFHTGMTGELLLAFVGSDGPASGGQTATVSGAGLTWSLIKRANTSAGDSEVWQATATSVLSGVTVTASQAKTGYRMFLNVLAVQGTAGVGASVAGSASTGAPSVSLTTTQPQSLVFGVGNDWDQAVSRTVGPNQAIDSQFADTATGDTYWTQNTTGQSGAAGSVVVLNDTAPTTDRWNMVAVEVLAANASNYLAS